jgi:hypothetical protein
MSKMVSAAPGGTMLDPDTKAHLFNDLLTIDGAPLPDDYPLAGCGDTERSTGTPADRADERSWAEENFSWLSDVWDALKWIGLILLLIIIVILLVLLTIFTAGAGLPLWAALPIVAVEVAVALGVAVLAVAAVVASLARVPETENHLLMINTSRYLTNQLIIQANPTDVDFFVEDQKKVKAWLLARLQRITARDFDEFNARPYQRYSIIALLNLHDFGPCNPALRDANIDCDLRTATEIVLDLATAKFEAGSNEGRRSAPFRRLMEAVGDDVADSRRLTQGDSDSDYMFGFMLDYAGHTQHLPDHKAQFGTAAEMIYPATSNYQPAPAVMSLALGPKNFEQRIHHAGVEIYSSTPSFLISAGGIRTVAATAFSVGPIKNLGERCVDRGAALPTVLIPGGGQYQAAPPWSDAVQRNDFLRIEGFYYHYGRTALCLAPNDDAQTAPPPLQADKAKADRTNDMWSNDDNICVHKGFACGTNIIVPPALAPCFTPQPGTPWSFLNSATCAGLPASAPFHVALYVKPCPAGAKDCLNNWGFFEAVEGLPGAAGAAGFVVFKLRTLSNNPASLIPDPSGGDNPALGGTYVSARGERIEFDAAATFNDKARPGVGKVNGTAVADINKWPRAEGDVIASKTCPGAVFPFVIEGQYEITGHQNGVTIDFCDVANPKRVLH